MNKKEIFVIILAIFIAFIIAYTFIHKKSTQHTPIEIDKQQTNQENQINNQNNNIFELTEEEEEKSRPALEPIPTEEAKQDIIKINKNIETHKKQTKTLHKQETLKINNENPNTTMLETKLEETNTLINQEEENGIIVPVSYTSKNTYKYVYTPSKFNK